MSKTNVTESMEDGVNNLLDDLWIFEKRCVIWLMMEHSLTIAWIIKNMVPVVPCLALNIQEENTGSFLRIKTGK